jgi:hypothetical protein
MPGDFTLHALAGSHVHANRYSSTACGGAIIESADVITDAVGRYRVELNRLSTAGSSCLQVNANPPDHMPVSSVFRWLDGGQLAEAGDSVRADLTLTARNPATF